MFRRFWPRNKYMELVEIGAFSSTYRRRHCRHGVDLVLVPEAAVVPVPGMDAEGLIKLYFSFGVLAPEIIPPRTEV